MVDEGLSRERVAPGQRHGPPVDPHLGAPVRQHEDGVGAPLGQLQDAVEVRARAHRQHEPAAAELGGVGRRERIHVRPGGEQHGLRAQEGRVVVGVQILVERRERCGHRLDRAGEEGDPLQRVARHEREEALPVGGRLGDHVAAVAEADDAVASRGRPAVVAVVVEVEEVGADQAQVGDAVVVELAQQALAAEHGDVVLAGEHGIGGEAGRDQLDQVRAGRDRAHLDRHTARAGEGDPVVCRHRPGRRQHPQRPGEAGGTRARVEGGAELLPPRQPGAASTVPAATSSRRRVTRAGTGQPRPSIDPRPCLASLGSTTRLRRSTMMVSRTNPAVTSNISVASAFTAGVMPKRTAE